MKDRLERGDIEQFCGQEFVPEPTMPLNGVGDMRWGPKTLVQESEFESGARLLCKGSVSILEETKRC